MHNEQVTDAAAGCRTAVNLQGIEKAAIRRGEILSEKGRFAPSHRVNASFHCLKNAPKALPNRFRVMVHWGTERVFGRIVFLDPMPATEPGNTGWARISGRKPDLPGDRRSIHRPGFLDQPYPGRWRHPGSEGSEVQGQTPGCTDPLAERLKSETPEDKVGYLVWKQGVGGCSLKELIASGQMGADETQTACLALVEKGELVEYDPEQTHMLGADAVQGLSCQILDLLREFHRTSPYQRGMPKEALRSRLSESIPEKLVAFTVGWLTEKGEVAVEKDRMRCVEHRVQLTDKDEECAPDPAGPRREWNHAPHGEGSRRKDRVCRNETANSPGISCGAKGTHRGGRRPLRHGPCPRRPREPSVGTWRRRWRSRPATSRP